ncbi:Cof-type HAD-IIB family hydrolase [Microcella humidisoli]|uniref:Hydroxymethylpyrimidine pyrophosphatase-like HAD family hydrolase n=1 Tax=Microcella humidisoli TaxID=2963406 RepID=A0ABY5FVI6_9MICO|nr:hypothetical protein [Microcella humidisoli]UTT62263.1 hypothetical protein NNL39_11455 [Microcella humidisoli]
MPSPAPFGLLLDVDGPIASPIERRIVIDSIVDDLLTLAAAGIPIAFITGRSDAFMREQVVAPLVAGGLDAGAHVFGVFEKGGCWAPVTPQGLDVLEIDTVVAVPVALKTAVESLAREHYADTMFVDDGKHVMISIEQRTDVTSAVYRDAQLRFIVEVERIMAELAVGPGFRIDPTIISIDVESVLLDKDLGAARALDWFAARGVSAERWWSVGDSRSDYLMADAVHARGIPVAHVDVRPGDGMLDRPYDVVVESDLIHDAAGAAFLRRRVAELD